MIKVGFMGGVGNMLFQLARGASLAEAGEQVCFFHVLPRSRALYRCLGWTYQPYWLDIAELAAALGLSVGKREPADYLHLGATFIRNKSQAGSAHNFDRPLDRALTQPRPLDLGYFQSPVHLSTAGISRVLEVLAEHLGTIPHLPGITLHLRGADIAIQERLTVDDIAILLDDFSADLPMRVVGNDRAYMAELKATNLRPIMFLNGTPFSDFCTIAASERLILSSSTFSFWAAALANASGPCPIHVQPGSTFTRFPALFPEMTTFGSTSTQRTLGTKR
jgi:hypothetical protein